MAAFSKRMVVDSVDGVFRWAERRGWIRRLPAFEREYRQEYRGLQELEANYPAIREECLGLLRMKERLVDMEALGGKYTAGGVHSIKWKTYTFKVGDFIPENCARCPRTTALLEKIPGLFTAFFSVLDPHQHISPHWGYYKGFVRYHLGVLIPRDNADKTCWLRINVDPAQNAARDRSLVTNGERYYWKNGEGILFDDTNLHEAMNDSDEVRVVLFLDICRRMPLPLRAFNRVCLFMARRLDGSLRGMRKTAIVRELPAPAPEGAA